MAKYEIGVQKRKTEYETLWKGWIWIKGSENNILELLGKLIRKLFLKDKI
jgi:hypothetical protein